MPREDVAADRSPVRLPCPLRGARPLRRWPPIMPTGFYGLMTEEDLDALVAYIRSVPPVKNAVQAPVYK
ncbi:MAG: hypothetical protein WCJ21_04820, partial [Planctomycetota bacterium]